MKMKMGGDSIAKGAAIGLGFEAVGLAAGALYNVPCGSLQAPFCGRRGGSIVGGVSMGSASFLIGAITAIASPSNRRTGIGMMAAPIVINAVAVPLLGALGVTSASASGQSLSNPANAAVPATNPNTGAPLPSATPVPAPALASGAAATAAGASPV